MNIIKKHSKRALALLLSLVMCLGMLPGTAFAIGTDASGSTSSSTEDADGPQITKTVSWDGNGNYSVEMDAYVTGKIGAPTSVPLDIVLVIDQSGSMKDDLSTLKNALNGFVQIIRDDKNEDGTSVGHKLAIIGFAAAKNTSSSNNGIPVSPGSSEDYWINTGLFVNGVMKNYETYTRSDSYKQVTGTPSVSDRTTYYILLDGKYQKLEWKNKNAGTWSRPEYELGYYTRSNGEWIWNPVDYTQTELYTKSNYETHPLQASDYQAALTPVENDSVTTAISNLSATGGTYTEYGILMAQKVFEHNALPEDSNRQRVVVVFTDGDTYSDMDATLKAAKAIKESAKIFTVSLNELSGDDKKFLDCMSSNYPNATGILESNRGDKVPDANYYKETQKPNELKGIFSTIAGELSSISLGTDAILYDTMSDKFTLPEGANASSVTVKQVDVKEFDANGKPVFYDINDQTHAKTLTIGEGKDVQVVVTGTSVEVKGFDYAANAVFLKDNTAQGSKLVIFFPIVPNKEYTQWGETGNYSSNNGAGIKHTVDGTDTSYEIPDDPIDDVNKLHAKVDTYTVTYSASGLPENGTLYDVSGNVVTVPTNPSLGEVRFIEGQDYNRVPTGSTTETGIADAAQATYPAENTVYYTKDADGNINGAYKFGGWQRGNSTIVGNENVIISGTWNLETVPSKPTDDELASLIDKVVVDCVNTKASHADETYKWSDNITGANANTVGLLGVNASGEYTVTVTLNAEGYAALYDNGANEHALVTGTPNVDVALKWNSGAGTWERVTAIEENAADATFLVECGFPGSAHYTIRYLDKDNPETNLIQPEQVNKFNDGSEEGRDVQVGDVIYTSSVVDGAFNNSVEKLSRRNVLNFAGYMYDSADPGSFLTIDADSEQNVIKLYYQKVTCTVNFYSHDNGQPIAAPVTISGLTPDTMYDAKAIETLALSESPFTVNMLKDYTFVEATGAPLTITHATGNVVNLFYTKQPSASYTVYYMEDGTTNQIADAIDETRNVVVGDKIDPNTYTGITISGYTFKEASPAEWVVEDGRNSFILYYTKDTSTSYTVNYYYQGEAVPFSSTYEPNAVVGALIPIDETPAGYKQVEVTGPLNVVEGSDNIVNVYYAKRTDLRYTVEYYKDTLEPKNRIAIRPGEGTLGDPIVPSAKDLTKFKPTGAYADGVVIDKQKMIMADEAENVVRVLYLPTGPAEYRYTIVYWQDAVDTGYCLGTEEEASSVPVADVILTNAQLNAKKHLLEAGYWDGVQVGEPNAKNEIHVVYTKTGTMEHTVTYEWGTAPAGAVLPVDRKTYGFGQPYTVDIAYAKDDEMTAYGEEDGQLYLGTWTFSGWKLNGQVVAGEQTMGSDNVVLTGEWTFTKNSTPPSTGPVKVEYFIEYYYEDENGEFVLDEEKTVEKVATLADKDVTVTVVAEEADIAVGNREYFTYVRYGGVSVTSGKVKVPTSESDIVRLKLCYSRDKYGVTYKWASSYPEGVALPQDSGKYYVGQDIGLQYPNLTLRYDEDGVLLGWWEFQGWNSLDLETTSVAMAVGGITLSGTWKYTPCEVEGYDIRVIKEADKTEVEIGDDVTWLITVENVRDDISYTGLSLKEILTGVYKMTPEEVANGDWLTITGEYERSGLAPYDGIAIDEEDAGDVNDTANDTVNDTTNDTTGGDTTSGPSDSDTSAGGIDGAGADNDIQILSVIPFYGPDDDIDPSMFVDGANWMDFDLGPKDIVRFYVTYTVQKGDQDLTNQVVVKRGDETLGGADEDPVKVVEPDPDVSVEKTPGKTSYTVGEDVIWNIVVTNNGKYKVEGLNLTDSLSGNGVVVTHPTLDPDSFAIAPEDSVTFTATLANAPAGTYTNAVVVSKGSDKLHEDTADEVKVSGLFTVTYTDGVSGAAFADQTTRNIVEGTATPVFIGTPTREGYVFIGWGPAVAGTVTGDATYTAQWRLATEPVTPNPSFTVVKTADRTTASVGDVITYTITVTNNGNVDLTNIVVRDRMMPNGSETIASLPVGDVQTITYRHTVTAAEAGTTLRNTVTVSGTNPNPGQEDPDDETATIDTPVDPVTPPPVIIPPVTPTPVIPDPVVPLDPGTSIPDEEVPLAGAVGLNDVDHFAYIIGRDEDHVYPLSNITRAEVATIFFRLMTDDYRSASWSTSNDFADVKAGDWYNNAISTCANAGALSGYPDGSFKPNASITRAEFAAIAARFLDKELYTDDGVGDFSDTADHWAAKEIRLAAKAGWIRGDGNTFRPNDPITRAEVMTIVNRMLDRIPDKDHMLPDMKKWIDNPEDAWYYEAVQEATNEHAYERDAETGVIETWTEILTPRDWKAIETEWVANGGKSAPVEDPAQPAEGEGEVETETQSLPDGI